MPPAATGAPFRSQAASDASDSVYCKKAFVVAPALVFTQKGKRVSLTDALETLKLKGRFYPRCEVVSQKPLPAHWSTNGGTLHVLPGRAKAVFLSAKLGAYTIQATSGIYSASATVDIQLNNEKLVASIGGHPDGTLLAADGSFYGVTYTGGASGNGSVFKLTRGAVETIYSFQGGPNDGEFPGGALIADKKGDFFGTTFGGGTSGDGTVFELMPAASGYTERLLHSFSGTKGGANPVGGLVADGSGALYGTTTAGYQGTAFKLTPRGSAYAFRILHYFNGTTQGSGPSPLILGPNGSLYGTNAQSDAFYTCGTAFKLTPHGTRYVFGLLYRFKGGRDGCGPTGVVAGKAGVLYGVTANGGSADVGTVFELRPDASAFTERILYRFRGGNDGAGPIAITLGLQGVLYGATSAGGAGDFGTVFALTPSGATYKERLLHTFESGYSDGYYPDADLITNTKGALYGVTEYAPDSGDGSVFEVRP